MFLVEILIFHEEIWSEFFDVHFGADKDAICSTAWNHAWKQGFPIFSVALLVWWDNSEFFSYWEFQLLYNIYTRRLYLNLKIYNNTLFNKFREVNRVICLFECWSIIWVDITFLLVRFLVRDGWSYGCMGCCYLGRNHHGYRCLLLRLFIFERGCPPELLLFVFFCSRPSNRLQLLEIKKKYLQITKTSRQPILQSAQCL